jgi:hypothetical protein
MTPTPTATWLKKTLESTDKITIAIPDDLAPRDIGMRIREASMLTVKVEAGRDRLHAILGRLLVLAKRSPEVYQAQGFDTFTDYLRKEVLVTYKVGRTTAMNCKRIAEQWGGLTVEQYGKVGQQKLLLLSKFSSQENTNAPKLLKAAAEKSFDQLKTYCEEKGFLGEGEADGASITFTGSLAEVKELRRYQNRPDFQAHAGKGIAMILAAMNEVEADWTAQAADALKRSGAAAD